MLYAFALIFGARRRSDEAIGALPNIVLRMVGRLLKVGFLTAVNGSTLALRLATAQSQSERASAFAVFAERMADAALP